MVKVSNDGDFDVVVGEFLHDVAELLGTEVEEVGLEMVVVENEMRGGVFANEVEDVLLGVDEDLG